MTRLRTQSDTVRVAIVSVRNDIIKSGKKQGKLFISLWSNCANTLWGSVKFVIRGTFAALREKEGISKLCHLEQKDLNSQGMELPCSSAGATVIGKNLVWDKKEEEESKHTHAFLHRL